MNRAALAAAAVRAVLPRPRLWRTAVRVAHRTAPSGWWRRVPFLPVPSARYLEFRLLTQYGDDQAVPTVDDIVHYLTWCRDLR